jgi:hypothetical protein
VGDKKQEDSVKQVIYDLLSEFADASERMAALLAE